MQVADNLPLEADPVPMEDEDFEYICILKKDHPKASFRDLRHSIYHNCPRLRVHSIDMIAIMFKRKRGVDWKLPADLFQLFVSDECQTELLKMAKQPAQYLMNNVCPFFIPRKNEHWTKEEDYLLIEIMSQSTAPIFSFLGLCFPGRTGKQIHQHFRYLLKLGKINDPRMTMNFEPRFNPLLHRNFLPNSEKMLADIIIDLFNKGAQVDEEFVIRKARWLYKLPWVLGERAAFQIFSHQSKEIYKSEKHVSFTDDFKESAKDLKERFQDLLNSLDIHEDDDEEYSDDLKQMFKKYSIPVPSFTHHWFKSFLKRNKLSIRKAHYLRRGSIDMKYARRFIKRLAKFVTTYGWDNVYNMDETSVRINNGNTRTIAPIGLDTIEIDAKRNEKECFTAIGTCKRSKVLPLIILKRGMKNGIVIIKGQSKLRSGDRTEVWSTCNKEGWMNESIMLKYLQNLYDKYTKGAKSALVIDCYRAHKTPTVLETAKVLNIEIMLVPANGTGKYQPLDRALFGILKAKLRTLAKSKVFSGKDRFNIIYQHLMKSWAEFSERAFDSAWALPGLAERIEAEDGANSLFEEEEEEFIIEEEEEDISDVDLAYEV